MKKLLVLFANCLFLLTASSFAGEADVIKAEVTKRGGNSYSFHVTVLHGDTGWNHYANKWDIIDDQGNILATRTLHHPHVGEQPFTRSLSGVKIPSHIKRITIRAHDLVHKYGGKDLNLKLP